MGTSGPTGLRPGLGWQLQRIEPVAQFLGPVLDAHLAQTRHRVDCGRRIAARAAANFVDQLQTVGVHLTVRSLGGGQQLGGALQQSRQAGCGARALGREPRCVVDALDPRELGTSVFEVPAAPGKLKADTGAWNKSLATPKLEQQAGKRGTSPAKVPQQRKTA